MDTRTLRRGGGAALAFVLFTASGLAMAGPPFVNDGLQPGDHPNNEVYVRSQRSKDAGAREGNGVRDG